MELLRAYVDAVLLRDVVERHSVSQPLALRYLARRLLSAPASAFSVNRFHRDVSSQGIAVGKDTLYAYLSHLEDAFLFRLAPVATESERRRMSNPRKAYPADQGLIHAFNRSGRPNLGHALETAVLHELDRRGAEVAYVKSQDGSEVDFLARYWDGREELVQVAADTEGPDTSAREIRGLHSAMVDYPRAEALLIVLDRPGVPLDVPGVRVIEAADWMLSPSAPVG